MHITAIERLPTINAHIQWLSGKSPKRSLHNMNVIVFVELKPRTPAKTLRSSAVMYGTSLPHFTKSIFSRPVTTNDTLESILEPLDRLRLVDFMRSSNLCLASSPLRNALTRSSPTSNISTVQRIPRPTIKSTASLTCNSRSPFRRYQLPDRT